MVIVLTRITMWLVLWTLLGVCTASLPYNIVRLRDNNTAYLLLRNHVAKQINEEVTITSLGYDFNKLDNIDLQDLSNYKIGPHVPKILKENQSPDEITRVEVLKCKAVMGKLIKSGQYIGEYMNPAIIKWHGRLILVTGSNMGQANSKRTEQGLLGFRWLNSTLLPFEDNDRYLGIAADEMDVIDKKVYGEDPRIVSLTDDRFMVFFAYPFQPLVHIGMLEVSINPTTKVAEIVTMHKSMIPDQDFYSRHKNWVPFLGKNGDVLLLQKINPMLVVKPTIHPDTGLMHAEVVSSAPEQSVMWPYGTLRGGTNAVFLEEHNVYLAFFHTKTNFVGNFMASYVAGAYTFSSEAPYKLLSISAMPIVDEKYYSGPWSPIKHGAIDYIFFPTAFFMDGSEIVMSVGVQDHSGFIVRLDLQAVLDTMVPV